MHPIPTPSSANSLPLLRADITRRASAALLLGGLGAVLSACAGPGGAGGSGLHYTREQLNAMLARSFPLTRSVAGLAEMSLQAPRVGFLPQSNRLSTGLDVQLAERLSGRRAGGGMDLDYGLGLDLKEGAVRLKDVQVRRLALEGLSAANQNLLTQYGPLVAQQLLNGLKLVDLPPGVLALGRTLGLGDQNLRVLPDALTLALG